MDFKKLFDRSPFGSGYAALAGGPSAWGLGRQGARGGFGSSGALGPAGRPLQVAGTGGNTPISRQTFNSSAQQRIESRYGHYTGRKALTEVRLAFSCYRIVNGVETTIGNDGTIAAHIEYNSVAVVCTFSGASTLALSDGTSLVITDPIPATAFGVSSIPAQSRVFSVSRWDSPTSAGFWPQNGRQAIESGEKSVSGSTGTTQIGTAGALSVPSGGQDFSAFFGGFGPTALLGKFVAPEISVAVFGDSIVSWDGVTTATSGGGNSNGGFAVRALFNVGGNKIPWIRGSAGSTYASEFNSGCSGRQAILRYCTHVLYNYLTNDIANTGGATERIRADNVLIALRAMNNNLYLTGAYGRKIHTSWVKYIARTSSSDSWATVANQTTAGHYGSGECLDLVCQDMTTDALTTANGLAEVIDISPYVMDVSGGNPFKFQAGATSDGIHPTNTTVIAAIAAGANLQNAIAAWVP